MPDDDRDTAEHTFDREPSTGNPQPADTTEHADIDHRIEAETAPDAPAKPAYDAPSTSAAPEPVAPSPVAASQSSPVTSPLSQASPEPVEKLPKAGPGLMVLQWLVYAFWGWTVLVLSGLVTLVVGQLVVGANGGPSWDMGSGIAYLLAAVIVLFIISLVSDAFYARAERKHARSSGTNVIMIIHAVIFALFGIGALIWSVFGVVSLMIGESGGSQGSTTSIIAGGIIAVVYGMTLLRTLRPGWIKAVVPMYWAFMGIVVLVAAIMGVIGPVNHEKLRNADRIIETELPALVTAINDQTSETGELPKTLSDVKSYELVDGEEQRRKFLATMVTYTPGERLTSDTPSILTPSQMDMRRLGGANPAVYTYEVCVTYKTVSGSGQGDSYRQYRNEGQRYSTSVYTYDHKAGEQCYDVQTDYLY